MNKIIVTMAIGDYLRWGNELTLPLIRDYAKLYDWDFMLVDHMSPWRLLTGERHQRDTSQYSHYIWEMMDWFYELLGQYDRLLSVPVDCIVRPDARDLSVLPTGIFYGCDELPTDTDPRNEHWGKTIWEYAETEWPAEFARFDTVSGARIPRIPSQAPAHLFNTGPMLVDRSHRELFKPVSKEVEHGMLEMAVVNMRLYQSQRVSCDLRPDYFNASNAWFRGQPIPDFLNILWQSGTKEEIVRLFMPRMGYPA